MPATVYSIPADIQPSAQSAAVLSVPTYVDEAPSMYRESDPSTMPANIASEASTVETLEDQPALQSNSSACEASAEGNHTGDCGGQPSSEAPLASAITTCAGLPAVDDLLQPASTPATLPTFLAGSVVNQTHLERRKQQKRVERAGDQHPDAPIAAPVEAEEAVDSSLPVDQTTPLSPVDDPDNPDWKDHWPSNELVIYAVLDPSTVQAPTVDGVRLIRTQAQITEIDPETSEVGIVAKVPVQILPMARGYEPFYNEITRARRLKQRVRPFIV